MVTDKRLKSRAFWLATLAITCILAVAVHKLSFTDCRGRDGVLSIGWPIPYYTLSEFLFRDEITPIPREWNIRAFGGMVGLLVDVSLYFVLALIGARLLIQLPFLTTWLNNDKKC
jgi:hypothetical protein